MLGLIAMRYLPCLKWDSLFQMPFLNLVQYLQLVPFSLIQGYAPSPWAPSHPRKRTFLLCANRTFLFCSDI